MKRYRLSAILLSPLAVQRHRQSNTSMTVKYLPGSSLRGALAAKHLRLGGSPEDQVFRTLFIENSVRFPNLLPSGGQGLGAEVLPITALSCKHVPGFQSDGGHGIIDALVLRFFESAYKQNVDPKYWVCPNCGSELRTISGFWNGDVISPCRYEVSTVYQNHTGIDRATGTIASSVFFTTQAVANGIGGSASDVNLSQHLSGELFLDDKHLEVLRPLIDEGSLFVGAERTRGYGEMMLSVDEAVPAVIDLSNWSTSFQGKFRRVTDADLPEALYFSVKLESHAVIVDQFLRPDSNITFSFENDHIELVMKMAKSHTIRGWQSAWGLPKPDDVGLSMGSIFLFKYTGNNRAGLENVLSGLMVEGIGLRREEGLGRVSVCDSIHIREVI